MVVAGLALAILAVAVACNSSSSGNTGGPGGPGGPGVCASACAKSCAADQDCDTTSGELCCNYGNGNAACAQAKSCPKFCTDDTACDTTTGQACELVSFQNSQKACELPQQGIHLCQSDNDCATGGTTGQVCCGIYKQSFCLPASECPKGCSTSTDCNTALGEICCTSVHAVEPSLGSAAGLCLNATNTACPKACASSADCSAQGQLCCNGICAATCAKSCNSDTDCNAQICCHTTDLAPQPPHIFSAGPSCTGTETVTSCAQCGNTYGCGTTRCPGCTSQGGG
jgi:hypothetical protein